MKKGIILAVLALVAMTLQAKVDVEAPVFVNGTPKSFATVFSYQIIDGLLVFIHLHDGSPLPSRLWKRIG